MIETTHNNRSSGHLSLRDKAGKIVGLGHEVGFFQTAGLVCNWLADKDRQSRVDHPALAYPIWLTPKDVLTFDETITRRANIPPKTLHPLIVGRRVVDVGANIGATTTLFATTFSESPVIAIEPYPRNIEHLRQNANPYGDQITVVEAALASQGGWARLDNPEKEAMGHHGAYRFIGESGGLSINSKLVRSITPDDIYGMCLGKTIGLLKIDVEGAEKELFADSMDRLLRIVNVLAIETHDHLIPGCYDAVRLACERNNLLDVTDASDYIRFFTRRAPQS